MAPFPRKHHNAGGSKGSPMATNDNAESSGTTSVRSPTLDINQPSSSLRSRFSPRLSQDQPTTGVFEAQQKTYPASSSRSLLSGWGSRGKPKDDGPSPTQPQVQMQMHEMHAPTPIAAKYSRRRDNPGENDAAAANQRLSTIAVPRFDSRGYPIRAAPELKVSIISSNSSGAPSPRSPQNAAPPPHTPSPRRSPRPVSSSSEEGTPKKYRYPPSSYTPDDSARSSMVSEPATPSRSRRSSAGSEHMYSVYPGQNRGPTPGASLFGDSTQSFETQHTDASHAAITQKDMLRANFSPSATCVATSYNDFTYDQSPRKGAPVLMAYLDDPGSFNHDEAEDDDFLHDPADPDLIHGRKQTGLTRSLLTVRGAANVGCMVLLIVILVALFMGYPVATALANRKNSPAFTGYAFTNSSGQVPVVARDVIDPATPKDAYFKQSMETGEQWKLVFSDEFETDGRTFYPGDDPYWTAVDLHYWPTNNKEWYDPKMITTRNGSLVVTLTNEKKNGLNYTGGMISTWNQFCFTGGYVEALVSLPGTSDVWGLWPAIWTMGNLGRAGYGGTNDGLWPYSYNSCDVGTLHNQTLNGQPKLPKGYGDKYNDDDFNYLPGQRFSSCTCPGDPSHPGPVRADGTYVGRAAPEIDMFEAAVDDETAEGHVSLSAQWAPFNPAYTFLNTSADTAIIYDKSRVSYNTYQGSVLQQATSGLGITNQNCYTGNTGCFSVYGVEYMPKDYITWRSDNRKAWTIRQASMGPNAMAGVGQRDVSVEPMYLIVNLGLSENFGAIDYEGLAKQFPVEMLVEYIRVYQHPDHISTTCDPPDYPTADFIAKYPAAYHNPNITTFQDLQKVYPELGWPKNRLIDQC